MINSDDAAVEALTDMPPRSEEELDPVTLHNQALMNIDKQPSDGFAKLQYLLNQNPFPPETFPNLLLLYCKYEVRWISIAFYCRNTSTALLYSSTTIWLPMFWPRTLI